jgi:hypothetical protein
MTRRTTRLWLAVATVSALCPALAQAADPALLGCWRGQHMQVWLADGKHRDQNGDCVVEYDGERARSRCHSPTADSDRLYAYESRGPGVLRLTAVDATTRKPTATWTDISYRIDGQWLITTQRYAKPPAGAKEQPDHIVNLSVRVDTAREGACKPRGETGLRVGRLSVSSLALKLPAGWEPILVDPAADKKLGLAVNNNFFIGAFVPSGTDKAGTPPPRWVLVLDDFRYGPAPIREKEFVEVKKRFDREKGTARLTCDLPDRVCAILHISQGAMVYTELVNLQGRVATIHSSNTSTESAETEDSLRAAARTFVDQLRLDNP